MGRGSSARGISLIPMTTSADLRSVVTRAPACIPVSRLNELCGRYHSNLLIFIVSEDAAVARGYEYVELRVLADKLGDIAGCQRCPSFPNTLGIFASARQKGQFKVILSKSSRAHRIASTAFFPCRSMVV